MRALLALVVLCLALAVGAWFASGRVEPPAIEIRQPATALGRTGTLEVAVTVPASALTALDVHLAQGTRQFRLYSLADPTQGTLAQEADDRVRVTRPLTIRELPEMTSGPAQLIVTAARGTLFGWRTLRAQATRDLRVRLEPPRVSVLSMHHFINHGGSELVVYRATPADVASGVRVGDLDYPGFPATSAGVAGADPSLKVAFFGLLHDQDLATPIRVFARDEAGNEATAEFDYRVFPKPFRRSTIPIEDRFLARVVPAILDHTPGFGVNDPENLEQAFLAINGELRRRNAETIAGLAAKTAPTLLWEGAFRQLTNSQVESAFADQRTYMYGGREIDRQVHLGFDLAVTANIPVKSANRGIVVFADYLGIYGNCVIVDHGLGVQSLYAHLSSFDVKAGDRVEKDQPVGRSGMTGLAGGDHLHFTMLVHGHPVTPVDWWSPQWIEDRILRKLREAGAPDGPGAAVPAESAQR
jgi:murein DD-endopeptidase MepM/ murein hydrolase activator NlpD